MTKGMAPVAAKRTHLFAPLSAYPGLMKEESLRGNSFLSYSKPHDKIQFLFLSSKKKKKKNQPQNSAISMQEMTLKICWHGYQADY